MIDKLPTISKLDKIPSQIDLKSASCDSFNVRLKSSNLKSSISGDRKSSTKSKKVNFDPNVLEIRAKSVAPSRLAQQEEIQVPEHPHSAFVSSSLNAVNEQVDQELANLAQHHLKSATVPKKYGHFLHYFHEETPQYIIDAKKRLGQVKPRTPPTQKQVIVQHNIDDIIDRQIVNINLDASQKNVNPHVPRHFLTYDSPPTPQHIRDIRKNYGDERYRKDDPNAQFKFNYTSMKAGELQKYMADKVKTAIAIPVPNFDSTVNNRPVTASLKRSKTTVGFEKSNDNNSQEQVQTVHINTRPSTTQSQKQQQPITIIYNHFQPPASAPAPTLAVPGSASSNTSKPLPPEHLIDIANQLVANSFSLNEANVAADSTNQFSNPSNVEINVESAESDNENAPVENNLMTAEAQEWLNNEFDANQRELSPSKSGRLTASSAKRVQSSGAQRQQTANQQQQQQQSDVIVIKSPPIIPRPSTSVGVLSTRKTGSAASQVSKSHVDFKETEESSPMTFEKWLQTANEKEKDIVLSMLRSIDGTSSRPKSSKSDKQVQNSVTYGMRTRPPSSKRKLGVTRQLHKFPCEICERIIIKQHLWDMNRCSNCRDRGSTLNISNVDENEGYSNITSHFFNSMPAWKGQYVIHPDFTSEKRDLERINPIAFKFRSKSSLR